MLSALMIHGIAPGPNLIEGQPEIFWGLIMSFWIGNIILMILNVPLVGIWVRLLTIPYHIMFPAVLMFICVGTFTIHYSALDIWLVVFFGLLGYLMRLLDFPAAPLLLGFVLGPPLEEHFRRAMLLSRGDFMTFLERPISASVMLLTVTMLVWSFWKASKQRRSLKATEARRDRRLYRDS